MSAPDESEEVGRYLEMRKQYRDRYLDLVVGARRWQVGFGVLCGVLAVNAAATIFLAFRPEPPPRVALVDSLGQVKTVQFVGDLDVLRSPFVDTALTQFVTGARTVSADPVVQKKVLAEAYGYTNDATRRELEAHHQVADPFAIREKRLVSIQVESVLSQSDETWRVRWRERHRGPDGVQFAETFHEGLFTLAHVPPSETRELNPFGIYVTHFSWTQLKRGRR